jgi:hypothetical protein
VTHFAGPSFGGARLPNDLREFAEPGIVSCPFVWLGRDARAEPWSSAGSRLGALIVAVTRLLAETFIAPRRS